MEFTNRIIIRDTNSSEGYTGGSVFGGGGSSVGDVYWHFNDDNELAPIDESKVVKAPIALVIGDFKLEATADGLSITRKDGSVAHLFCSGDITAYKG